MLCGMGKASASGFRPRAILIITAIALSTAAFGQAARGQDTVGAPRLVLVLDCEGSGNYAATAKTLSGIIVAAVCSSDAFEAVSPESRDRALKELAFSLSDLARASAQEEVGMMTAARYVLSSKISQGEGELFLSQVLVEVGTGRIERSETRSYRSVGTMIDGAESQTLACLGQMPSDDQRTALRVKNATELVQALGSDRVIRLAPGRYDLSGLFVVKNRYIDWVDKYDGPCPVIKGVSNLTLIGEGGPDDVAEIVIAPAYGWVLSFEACTGIMLSDLVIGHTKPGYCLGGVVSFTRCDEVEIRGCELYGSGTYGLGLGRSSRFSIRDSVVRDCTYGLAMVEDCEDLLFESTIFSGTGEYELFGISSSEHLLFRDCEFSRNWGYSLFYVDGESRDIRMLICRFLDNNVKVFNGGDGELSLADAMFSGNAFGRP